MSEYIFKPGQMINHRRRGPCRFIDYDDRNTEINDCAWVEFEDGEQGMASLEWLEPLNTDSNIEGEA